MKLTRDQAQRLCNAGWKAVGIDPVAISDSYGLKMAQAIENEAERIRAEALPEELVGRVSSIIASRRHNEFVMSDDIARAVLAEVGVIASGAHDVIRTADITEGHIVYVRGKRYRFVEDDMRKAVCHWKTHGVVCGKPAGHGGDCRRAEDQADPRTVETLPAPPMELTQRGKLRPACCGRAMADSVDLDEFTCSCGTRVHYAFWSRVLDWHKPAQHDSLEAANERAHKGQPLGYATDEAFAEEAKRRGYERLTPSGFYAELPEPRVTGYGPVTLNTPKGRIATAQALNDAGMLTPADNIVVRRKGALQVHDGHESSLQHKALADLDRGIYKAADHRGAVDSWDPEGEG